MPSLPRFLIRTGKALPSEGRAPGDAVNGENPVLAAGSIISLDAQESHHLRHVLRLTEGQAVEVFDLDTRQSFRSEVLPFSGELVQIKNHEVLAVTASAARITLFVALVKPEKCDLIVEKCTEIGVFAVHFFAAERSQYRLAGDKAVAKRERWTRLAEAALKQSHSSVVPELTLSSSLSECVRHSEHTASSSEVRLMLTAPDNQAISAIQPSTFTAFFDQNQRKISGLQNLQEIADSYIIVGPEGGLTELEVSFANHWGYIPWSLGPNVLRTETAAIVGCGSLRAFLL